MSNLEGKKLPTIEQVETIIAEYGSRSVEEFADHFELEKVVVEATIESLKRLRRISGEETVPAIACYRDDNLDSIIRCAGSKHGYV